MKPRTSDYRSVTPEKAKKILFDNGLEVNEKEAEEILEFLYFLAKLSVNHYVNTEDNKKV
jgi:hypothetical protein